MEVTPSALTERQQEMAWLVLDGLPYKEIADRLRVSEAVVKQDMYGAYRKKGVSTRAQFMHKFAHLIVERKRNVDTNVSAKTD